MKEIIIDDQKKTIHRLQDECTEKEKCYLEKIIKENEKLKETLEEIREYINSQGIDNKWNMRIQRFRMGILKIINEVLK